MFLLSPHWKHHSSGGGSGGGRNKVAVVDHSVKEETSNVVIEEEEEEKLQAPMVRIGVLSRSRTVETVMVVPPSRAPSARVSDSSIETIRRSLREMEVQLVIAQDTVTAETRAEYDLRGETKEQQSAEAPPEMIESEKKKVLSYKEGDEENAQLPTNQDIKRVLDDLQWAAPNQLTHEAGVKMRRAPCASRAWDGIAIQNAKGDLGGEKILSTTEENK
ncbi:MAG: hypothetical protein SGBAC_006147 [Bacillariaceae sp.]